MSRSKVIVHLNKNSFPEVGLVGHMNSVRDAKPPKDVKDDYKNLQGIEQGNVLSAINSLYDYSDTLNGGCVVSAASMDDMVLNLVFDDNLGKTYKFLGMDIDEECNAVIPLLNGKIVVAPMFDKSLIKDEIKNVVRGRYTSDDTKDFITADIDSLNLDFIRKLITALKTGKGYDFVKGGSYSSVDPTILTSMFSDMGKSISNFNSVILSLVHVKMSEVLNDNSNDSEDNYRKVISCIALYWENVLNRYNNMYTTLAGLDLWSDVTSKIMGPSRFNSEMESSITCENAETGELENRVISFRGVAVNGSTVDSNAIRKSADSSLLDILISRRDSTSEDELKDFLVGCIDTTGIDDIYGMSNEELQALSALDTLQYIDEDATTVRESYDMDDPDERGLFIRSVVNSYTRNFKSFKPVNDFDVTEKLADMIENGDLEKSKPVSLGLVVDTDPDGDIITSSDGEIKATFNKKDLLKVLKLLEKTTKELVKSFG